MTRTVLKSTALCAIRTEGGELKQEEKTFSVTDTMNFDKTLTRWANKTGVKAFRIGDEVQEKVTFFMDDETFFRYATVVPEKEN